ncbi:MAG: hypothetical protein ACRDJP_02480 [Actinomycetota bacterium]
MRVLRALLTHDGTENLTARDVARRAGIAHTSFDDELHLDEAMIAFVRRRARERGRVLQVHLRRSAEDEAFLALNGRGLEGFEAQLWVEGLRQELAEVFGESVDVAVEARRPSALRGLMD